MLEKDKFDSLEVLRKAASDSFQFRTNFEWKISIALWTAEAALIGILLTKTTIIFHSVYSGPNLPPIPVKVATYSGFNLPPIPD